MLTMDDNDDDAGLDAAETEAMRKHRLECYRRAGRIAGMARDYGATFIKEKASLLDVANKVEAFIVEKGAKPAFPVNIAINDIAAHFTPRHDDGDLVFQRGDLVKLDVGAHVEGYIGDTALTVEVSTTVQTDLIRAAKEALEVAIDMVRPGVDVSRIGAAVEQTIKGYGFKPIRNLTGHGLRKFKLHGSPSVPNVKDRSKDVIKEGTFVALEPFSTTGVGEVDGKKNSNIYHFVKKKTFFTSRDAASLQRYIMEKHELLPFAERWCYQATKAPEGALGVLTRAGAIAYYPILKEIDEGMVAQAEHTVYVTANGAEILTTSK
jgi:methionyl aminopeptidase